MPESRRGGGGEGGKLAFSNTQEPWDQKLVPRVLKSISLKKGRLPFDADYCVRSSCMRAHLL